MKSGVVDGFSLIELMITITLTALIVTLTVVNVSFLHRGVIRSEVGTLYAACRYVQRCAMASNQQQVLRFNLKENSYTFDGRTATLAAPLQFGVKKGIKGPPSSPQKQITSPVTFKENTIIFSPNGVISSGTVYITDRQKKSLYALSNGIAQVSHLRKYSYNGKWVLLP